MLLCKGESIRMRMIELVGTGAGSGRKSQEVAACVGPQVCLTSAGSRREAGTQNARVVESRGKLTSMISPKGTNAARTISSVTLSSSPPMQTINRTLSSAQGGATVVGLCTRVVAHTHLRRPCACPGQSCPPSDGKSAKRARATSRPRWSPRASARPHSSLGNDLCSAMSDAISFSSACVRS